MTLRDAICKFCGVSTATGRKKYHTKRRWTEAEKKLFLTKTDQQIMEITGRNYESVKRQRIRICPVDSAD